MVSKIFTVLLVGLICDSLSFDFSVDYIKQNPGCSSNSVQQSPINLDVANSKYYDERMFRLLSTNYTIYGNSSWTKFDINDGNGLGFSGDFGTTLLMKNWALYKYDLKKVIFRFGQSHTINSSNAYNGEVELIHKVDSTYRTSGRYIKESSDYLVITIFLKTQSVDSNGAPVNNTEIVSNLLKDLSVSELKTKTLNSETLIYPSRRVKLNRIIQNNPQLMYEGRLTYGGCEKALYIIDPLYQLIDADSMNSLKEALNLNKLKDANSNSNSRTQQIIDSSTVIYRNDPSIASLVNGKSPFQYDNSLLAGLASFFLYGLLTLLLI